MNASPQGFTTRPRAGFTLLEIIMALTLLALLSGMVFGIVRVSLRTAMETQQMQMENDELNRFIMLCRQTFQSLPNTATITLEVTESGSPALQELTLSSVPEAFAFGANPLSYKDSILGLRPDLVATEATEDGERIYTLSLSREDLIPTDTQQSAGVSVSSNQGLAAPDDQGRFWMPLLANVTSVSWRCYKEEQETWEEEWDSSDLPQLVELNLMLKGRTLPIRAVFSLPTTKLTAANPSLAPKTSTTPTSGSSTQQTTSSGGGGDRGRGGESRGGERGRGEGGGRGGPPGAGPGGPQEGGPRSGGGGGSQNGGGSPQPSSGGGGSSGAPSGGPR